MQTKQGASEWKKKQTNERKSKRIKNERKRMKEEAREWKKMQAKKNMWIKEGASE